MHFPCKSLFLTNKTVTLCRIGKKLFYNTLLRFYSILFDWICSCANNFSTAIPSLVFFHHQPVVIYHCKLLWIKYLDPYCNVERSSICNVVHTAIRKRFVITQFTELSKVFAFFFNLVHCSKNISVKHNRPRQNIARTCFGFQGLSGILLTVMISSDTSDTSDTSLGVFVLGFRFTCGTLWQRFTLSLYQSVLHFFMREVFLWELFFSDLLVSQYLPFIVLDNYQLVAGMSRHDTKDDYHDKWMCPKSQIGNNQWDSG